MQHHPHVSPEQQAMRRIRLFAQVLATMPTDQATDYAAQVLDRCPLGVAVSRCQIGGLPPDSWVPFGHACRDAVIALHGGDSHFAMHNGSMILVPNGPKDEAA